MSVTEIGKYPSHQKDTFYNQGLISVLYLVLPPDSFPFHYHIWRRQCQVLWSRVSHWPYIPTLSQATTSWTLVSRLLYCYSCFCAWFTDYKFGYTLWFWPFWLDMFWVYGVLIRLWWTKLTIFVVHSLSLVILFVLKDYFVWYESIRASQPSCGWLF